MNDNMPVLVSDTSVLFDLDRSGLLELSFKLPFRFRTPVILYRRELESHNGDKMLDLGLELDDIDVSFLGEEEKYQDQHRKISIPDSLARARARKHGWILLTGDKNLRRSAELEGVECHGVLWVLDRIYEMDPATSATLYEGLTKLSTHPRCRLPREKITERLDIYSGNNP